MNLYTNTFVKAFMGKIISTLMEQGKYICQTPSEIIMLIQQMLDFSLDLHYGFYKYKWPQWMIEQLLN